MILQRQPNGWSCYPTCVSMLTGISVETLLELIGHDGSKVVSDQPDPWNRESFAPSEMAYALIGEGWSLVPLYAALENPDGSLRTKYPGLQRIIRRIDREGWKAVIVVAKPLGEHALAYDGETGQLCDPLTGESVTLDADGPPVKWAEILLPLGRMDGGAS